MKLILTHDFSDFDAVAAQLGAYKLEPDATATLSSHQNRNVRHFLAMYWDELPFTHLKDLPRRPVREVILVDTQGLPAVRQMHRDVIVRVVDHHIHQEDLPEGWLLTLEPVGAVSTIYAEKLRDLKIPLSPIEATLLMLGIYEDTGSLTYGATTARDIYAAGWLMEQGAILDVVNRFLHHSLSDAQRMLYEALVENAETHDIKGHSILIACADGRDIEDEIATLAHKLRDLYEPAAVFLLIQLDTHVQLVARGIGDTVDVGEIARRFGGGGHPRAAAAIIRGLSIEEAKTRLVEDVTALISPSITAADLMSHGVKTFSPTTRARDAEKIIRRYGYEGYPVVDKGAVVGLLTRRAIDRALDHGLSGVRIAQLMESGQITLNPDDPLEVIQRTMMRSGWGQIPVVDSTGHPIGIITRTDLLNSLGHRRERTTRAESITRLLEGALPAPLMALLRDVSEMAASRTMGIYVVGGFVRDLLLGMPNFDVDFVVEGDAISLTEEMQKRYGGETRSHGRFGTGKWLLGDAVWPAISHAHRLAEMDYSHLPDAIDFVAARTEFYDEPSVLPTVEHGSIKLDLHRRDFTINTLAIRLDGPYFGDLLDFYNGEEDLKKEVIRVLHSLSFIDDPTRILRAVRFEQRLGFTIEPRTQELIADALPLIEKLTPGRVRHELELILDEDRPEDAFMRLEALGVLRAIHPDFTFSERAARALEDLRKAVHEPLWPELAPPFDTEVASFAALTYEMPLAALTTLGDRLRIQKKTLRALEMLHALKAVMPRLGDPESKPSEIVALLDGTSDVVLLALWAAENDVVAREHIRLYAEKWRSVNPETDGETLKRMGLKPGPLFRQVISTLRAARLDGVIQSADDERVMLKELLSDRQAAQSPPEKGTTHAI